MRDFKEICKLFARNLILFGFVFSMLGCVSVLLGGIMSNALPSRKIGLLIVIDKIASGIVAGGVSMFTLGIISGFILICVGMDVVSIFDED